AGRNGKDGPAAQGERRAAFASVGRSSGSAGRRGARAERNIDAGRSSKVTCRARRGTLSRARHVIPSVARDLLYERTSRRGEIGRHAVLRGQWRKPWEFESPRRHQGTLQRSRHEGAGPGRASVFPTEPNEIGGCTLKAVVR